MKHAFRLSYNYGYDIYYSFMYAIKAKSYEKSDNQLQVFTTSYEGFTLRDIGPGPKDFMRLLCKNYCMKAPLTGIYHYSERNTSDFEVNNQRG